jgi:hypothetical protein
LEIPRQDFTKIFTGVPCAGNPGDYVSYGNGKMNPTLDLPSHDVQCVRLIRYRCLQNGATESIRQFASWRRGYLTIVGDPGDTVNSDLRLYQTN